jgi:hypothetical protein
VRVAVLQANIAQEDKWNPVLVDAIRGGRARERGLAIKELKKRLERYG